MEKGEIWVVDFPVKKGREQSGKRPSILISDTKTSIALVIPLTSNQDALKNLPNTTLINKSSENNLERNSVSLTFQLQAIDKRRLVHKLGKLEDSYLIKINEELKKILEI